MVQTTRKEAPHDKNGDGPYLARTKNKLWVFDDQGRVRPIPEGDLTIVFELAVAGVHTLLIASGVTGYTGPVPGCSKDILRRALRMNLSAL